MSRKPIADKVRDGDVAARTPARKLVEGQRSKQRKILRQQQVGYRTTKTPTLHENPQAAPLLTDDRASEMALILLAGVPPDRAVSYFAPVWATTVTHKQVKDHTRRWMNDPRLLQAMNRTNGGEWHTLPNEKRLQLAVDKNLAELAYYLYSHNFNAAYGDELVKSNEARKTLLAYLDDHGENAGAAWQLALQDIANAVRSGGKIDGVPDLPVLGQPILPTRES